MSNTEKKIPLTIQPATFTNNAGETIHYNKMYVEIDGQRIELKVARDEDKALLRYLIRSIMG